MALLLNVGPAQKRPYPKQHLPQLDGLDHVIVNPQLEALLLGGQVVPGGHEQDGNVLVHPPHGAGKLEAVDAGHHHVGDDQIVEGVVHGLVGSVGAEHAGGLKARIVQVGADGLIQLGVVVQDKNVDHALSSRRDGVAAEGVPSDAEEGYRPPVAIVLMNCLRYVNCAYGTPAYREISVMPRVPATISPRPRSPLRLSRSLNTT